MLQQKSKKILTYIFLFFIIGTLNNKNFNNNNFIVENEIVVFGLDEKNNKEILDNLKLIKLGNFLFLDKDRIEEIIISNDFVENYSVFKEYPSSLKVKINKTKFYAHVIKDDINFILGSNGKLIKTNKLTEDIPTIIGDFDNENFMKLKKVVDEINFDFFLFKNFFIINLEDGI